LPGLVWLALLATTYQVFDATQVSTTVSPLSGFGMLVRTAMQWQSVTLTLFVAVAMSLLIGHALNPIGTRLTWPLCKPLVSVFLKPYRGHNWWRLKFPFNEVYGKTRTFIKLEEELGKLTEVPHDEDFPHAPFSASKRLLRMIAPNAWEESERTEAQVRMSAAMFLGAVYSQILSLIRPIGGSLGCWEEVSQRGAGWWFFWSTIAAFTFAYGFHRFRDREVRSAYTNALIAIGLLKRDGVVTES
ncbi:MAG: hypothetical protein ABIJ61_06285, partial [bacterium]